MAISVAVLSLLLAWELVCIQDEEGGQPTEVHTPSTPRADSQHKPDAASTPGRAQQEQILQVMTQANGNALKLAEF